MAISNILNLPGEILTLIAEHLEVRDLFRFAGTRRSLWTATFLWTPNLVNNPKSTSAVRRILRRRPTLAQFVQQLKVFVDVTDTDQHMDLSLYPELEFAAGFPDLRSIKVVTYCWEIDESRSRKLAERLARLEHLESCDLHHWDANNKMWHAQDLTALLSLTKHPSMREFRLRHFHSCSGVTPHFADGGTWKAKTRTTPLRKLSLLGCCMDSGSVAELLNICIPSELEFVYRCDSFPNGRADDADAHDYIEAIRQVGNSFLERLTWYRYWDREDDTPLRFEGLNGLRYLSTTMESLCGYEFDERELVPEMSLPPQLEELDILYEAKIEWSADIRIFLESIIDHKKKRRGQLLQKLNFRTEELCRSAYTTIQEFNEVMAEYGLTVTHSAMPPDWND